MEILFIPCTEPSRVPPSCSLLCPRDGGQTGRTGNVLRGRGRGRWAPGDTAGPAGSCQGTRAPGQAQGPWSGRREHGGCRGAVDGPGGSLTRSCARGCLQSWVRAGPAIGHVRLGGVRTCVGLPAVSRPSAASLAWCLCRDGQLAPARPEKGLPATRAPLDSQEQPPGGRQDAARVGGFSPAKSRPRARALRTKQNSCTSELCAPFSAAGLRVRRPRARGFRDHRCALGLTPPPCVAWADFCFLRLCGTPLYVCLASCFFPPPSSCESIKIKTRTAPWTAGAPYRSPCARRTAGPSCPAASSSAPSAETLSWRSRTEEAAEVSGAAGSTMATHVVFSSC